MEITNKNTDPTEVPETPEAKWVEDNKKGKIPCVIKTKCGELLHGWCDYAHAKSNEAMEIYHVVEARYYDGSYTLGPKITDVMKVQWSYIVPGSVSYLLELREKEQFIYGEQTRPRDEELADGKI